MKPHPPRVATFLMTRVGRCEPALLGDLAEEFAARGSRLWYWREALAATARSIVTGVRQHPVVLLRAFAAYAVVFLVINMLVGMVVRRTPALFHIVAVSSGVRMPILQLAGLVVIFPLSAVAAWIVAVFHPRVCVPATMTIIAWALVRDAELHRLLANIGDARFLPYLLAHVAALLEFVSGLMIGVLLPTRRSRAAGDEPQLPSHPAT